MTNRAALLVVIGLLSSCATPVATPRTKVDPEFAVRRPTMVELRVDGPEEVAAALSEALYSGLIAKNYGVLAPGEPAGTVAGTFVAKVGGSEGRDAEATLRATGGRVVYEAVVIGHRGTPAALAALLLSDLPAK